MEIAHPRRLLALGGPDSGVLDVIKDLTGTAPPPHPDGSTAGLTHEWPVQTPYYHARVPVWIDHVADPPAWKADFLAPEARDVVRAVGAWVLCFRRRGGDADGADSRLWLDGVRDVMAAVREVQGAHGAEDALRLAVAMPVRGGGDGGGGPAVGVRKEEEEDLGWEQGFEWVDYGCRGRNEFGEETGFARVKEALEANEWAGASLAGDEEDVGDGEERELVDLVDGEEAEVTVGLLDGWSSRAGDEDRGVEDLEAVMGKLMAVREGSAGLPEAQRRELAARAVREVMGEGRG